MTPKPKIHITADVPVALLEKVDARVEELGFNRSFAIRQGLALFLYAYRQEVMENITINDALAGFEQRTTNSSTDKVAPSAEVANG